MPRRILSAVLLCALACVPACVTLPVPDPGQSTTRPVNYYAAQVAYWQRIVDRFSDPDSPLTEEQRKELAAARWWVRFFSEALAGASGQ